MRAALLVLSCAAGLGVARAETLYVVEQVVVNVNSAPDASGERIATVKSGEAMEVLEHVRDQVHVKLPSGKDGWIRASYLSADEPMKPRLAASTAELTRLKDELTRVQGQLDKARSAPAAVAAAPATSPAPAASSPAPEEAAPSPSLFASDAAAPPRRIWPWALGAGLGGLTLGAALGALLLDRHIRRKYGGLRIY